MTDIYQQIWDADQAASGVTPILANAEGDMTQGFVKVKNGPPSPDLRILDEVEIPERKLPTYELAKVLFDNYSLSEAASETETPEEREEVHELLSAVVDSPPMQVAREYVEQRTGTTVTKERWYATLVEQWFRQFAQSGEPHLTGFEHVFVGEQEGSKAQGYHFWYKYYLDDGFAREFDGANFPNLSNDRIVYLRSRAAKGADDYPESVTISYKWMAPDYDAGGTTRPLTKKIGGFFVGCSVEGLMALGTVRAHLGARAPKEAVINGARYNLKLYRSANNAHIRTFYPVFIGSSTGSNDGGDLHVGTVAAADQHTSSSVRIVAAVVNPFGHDPGKETVTLVNTGIEPVALGAWTVEDRNRQRSGLELESIAPGAFVTVRLSGSPREVQLSNKGGKLRLVDGQGRVVHSVSYSKTQVRREGETLIF